MRTIARPDASPGEDAEHHRAGAASRAARSLAGPALIVICVLIAMRGFVFENLLTNQHFDILAFWLPRSCFLGRSLAAGHVPLWNPFEMAGVPFAADPQSWWLYAPAMLLSWALPCGEGLRAFIVLQPLLAGLGLYAFLRMEGLRRAAATAGGLSIAVAIAASLIGISLPFSGTLAWTPFVLIGASGCLRATRWSRRIAWAALGALAWGQVASAHMSHGLMMCTGLTAAYVAAKSIHDVRARSVTWWRAAAIGVGFLALFPLANLAILVPRLALIERSSLHAGYAALRGTQPPITGTDLPLDITGVFAGWPFALATTPGAYVGAAILLMTPAALRDRRPQPFRRCAIHIRGTTSSFPQRTRRYWLVWWRSAAAARLERPLRLLPQYPNAGLLLTHQLPRCRPQAVVAR